MTPADPETSAGRAGRSPLAAVLAVAATYVYFLLFAQYGFLRLARRNLELGPDADLRPALAAMGICGLVASAVAGRLLARRSPAVLLQLGFGLGALVALVSLALHSEGAFVGAGALIGIAIALITVPLATWLPDLLASSSTNGPAPGIGLGLGVGLGTGAAYLLCNVPPIFEGGPTIQVGVSAGAAILGLVAVRAIPRGRARDAGDPTSGFALSERDARGLGFVAIVGSFLALVWLDSAAFAVIQETAPLKAPTWGSPVQKLSMGITHLLAAIAAGWAIDRGVFRGLLLSAFGLFAVAFSTLTSGAGPVTIAGPIYAIGISAYSVALVAYPGLVREARGTVPRRWRAATLYGVAGWLGSALGVGMAQNLHTIPAPFLWSAGALIAVAWLLSKVRSPLELGELSASFLPLVAVAGAFAVAVSLLGATAPEDPLPNDPQQSDPVERGRAVYVAEGCINCHSQYVRPESADVQHWGPFRPLERDEPGPVLIGNRRQGPDLLNVATRRSPTWQRLHLMDPRSVSPGSRMPSYAHLFRGDGRRGDDLVAYLDSLGAEERADRFREIQSWDLTGRLPAGDPARGSETFGRYCTPCHGPGAHGDGRLADEVEGRAIDLHKPGFWLVSWSEADGADALVEGLTKLIRWGMPGSDMPGHETLPEQDVADLVAYVLSLQEEDGGVVASVEEASDSKGDRAIVGRDRAWPLHRDRNGSAMERSHNRNSVPSSRSDRDRARPRHHGLGDANRGRSRSGDASR